jgi:O-antigen ligase
MLLIIFGVAIYPRLEGTSRHLLGLLLAISSVFLVLTYTRSALVGTVLGVIVVGLLQDKRILVALAIVAGLLLVANPTLASRFLQLGDEQNSIVAPETHNSLRWRFAQWAEVLKLSKSSPVTGIGLATTSLRTSDQRQPHNDFVRAYVEMGIVGFLAYLAVIVSLLKIGWAAVRGSPPASFDRSVGVGFLGCAIAFTAASVVANVMSNVVTLWYLLAFAAAAAAVAARHAKLAEDRELDRPSVGTEIAVQA